MSSVWAEQLPEAADSGGSPLLQPAGPLMQPNGGLPSLLLPHLQCVVGVPQGAQNVKQVPRGGLHSPRKTVLHNVPKKLQ